MSEEPADSDLDDVEREIDDELDSLEHEGAEMEEKLDDAEGEADEVDVPEPDEGPGAV